ncbi:MULTISPECIES: NuoM family protein [Dehalococcoides]|uniref:NADH:quinone oxidoreductase subunit 4 (Chain M) n=1 Tax=Dehalococcoides mccartyi (strain VS) TaxID=311424 RepID=D2BHY3_DEHMV|nr:MULTISPECIES: NADH-quinone oxidoreductase subunit M [Dehalococcoides]ACZ61933.1 NADH:quinone oxidoreductase subunit 4 (chain M) [Dehalococcoides mccartyi VS]AHB13591.1 NADH ubiquinone oxidoreductase chain M [Dehalococcoides mccartyi GY50]AII57977.1 oxidoreductase [Dehalococcoides mccartyi CG1]APH12493.1 oxidoreductase [Dehalococcoides mccartyi]QYY57996.1 NADH-quinone oxidoreductase subunit M [Dehalococcoides mccartyi]
MSIPYLTLITFLPAAGAILMALWPRLSGRAIKISSLLLTLVPLVLSLVVFAGFDRSSSMAGVIQFEENLPWISLLNANYHLGVDGLSLPFLVLTTLLGVLAVLISWKVDLRVKEFFVWLLILQTSITGVFVSLDLLLFFIFWELELIPMYFLISIWGAGRKEYSALKYVLYTLFGGAFILAGILILFFATGSLDIASLASTDLNNFLRPAMMVLTFFMFFIGFAIKLPAFPFHTWLPDAHTDAPTAASVILAGTLLKMGGYAMLRLNVAMFPDVCRDWAPLILTIAVINVIYGAAITLKQTDIKRLIAYSSVSHMGFVLLGIFTLGEISMNGAVLQMFSHGIITGLLFAITGVVMHNTHERDINKLGGLAKQMPRTAIIFILAGLGAMAVPATSGFIAEVSVFLGSFQSSVVPGGQVFTMLCLLGLVLAAAYILWTVQRVFLGPGLEKFQMVKDADKTEIVFSLVFLVVMFGVGLYPQIVVDVIQTGVAPLAALFGG